MYSNICKNTKCGLNNSTGFCKKIKKGNLEDSINCFCNLNTGRCIKQINNKNKQKIEFKTIIKRNDLEFTSLKKLKCYLNGFGTIYLDNLKDCYPLPRSSSLTYGILKRHYRGIKNNSIVYDKNYKFYEIEYINNNIIIYLDNYEILIESSKNCKLIHIY